ncbi:MAG TPA: hypothetical protein VGB55_15025 [Tepidisphaeraceae bacterium]|jgi:hypothetical protein
MISFLAQSFFEGKGAPYLVLGVGGIVIIYVVIRPFMRKAKDPLGKPAFSRSLSQQRSVERQMETLLVELSEMSRQMSAQLETRSAKLEILIKDADDAIARLKDAAHQIEHLPPRQNSHRDAPAAHATIDYSAPLPPITPAVSDVDARHIEIYVLSRDGRTADQIAHTLDRPVGEIELILALRPK